MTLQFSSWIMSMLFLSFLMVIGSALLTADDYYVVPELIPGLSSGTTSLTPLMYAGHIPLKNNKDGINYFFWKFVDDRDEMNGKPLMFWLNGGPGCSSMDGALAENGPLRIDENGKSHINEGSWHVRADIVYLDQPVNTGFSFANNSGANIYDDDLDVVTEHFMQFLESYFQVFPDDIYKDLMIAGESYAGQYIPYFANAILKHNDGISESDLKYNLKSIFIGNGWLDPNNQALSYVPFAKEKELFDITEPRFTSLLRAHEKCQNAINSHDTIDIGTFSYQECDSILPLFLSLSRDTSPDTPSNEACLNVYDYTLRDSYPSCGTNWPQEVLNIPQFFSTEGVLEALNVNPEDVPRWRECDPSVFTFLKNPRSAPSVHLLPTIMSSGVDVVLFNGDHDLICNTKSILDIISRLDWGGKQGFSEAAENYDWIFNDITIGTFEPAGYVIYEGNLTFINIYNGSHMVSNDKSMVSRGVVDIYLDNVYFEDDDGKYLLISNNELDPFGDENGEKDEDKDEEDFDGNDSESDDESNNENGSDYENGNNDEDESDDEDQGEEKLGNNDGNSETGSDNSSSGEKKLASHDRFRIFLVTIMSCALAIAIAYYIYKKKFKHGMRAILIDSNRRHDHNKSVSWADDLENGIDFDVNEEIRQSDSANSKPKSRGSYTSVPSTDVDESFELDDL